MNWIESITTNVKSPTGKASTTELGPKTLLIGPNESGKSTVVEALQLALSGAAYGILWRAKDTKDGKMLISLSPQGAEEVFAEAQISDGTTARWSLEEGKRPSREGSNGVTFPVAELHAVLMGSANTVRTFLFKNLIGSVAPSEVRLHLPASAKEAFDGFVGGEVAIDLTDILASISKNKRFCSDRIKAGQAVLNSCGDIRRVTDKGIERSWLELAKAQRFEKLKEMYRMYRAGDSLGNEDQDIALNRVRKMLSQLGSNEELQSMTSAAEMKSKLEQMLRDQGAFTIVRKSRDRVDAEETMKSQLEKLEKGLQIALDAVVGAQLEGFAAKVTEYLPKGEEFVIDVEKNKVIVGLMRGGELHTALSGSTEARTVAAMGAALVDYRRSSGLSDAGVLVIDDRMWDAATLARTMGALEDSPCQIVIMSTIKPKGRPRSGWTYVEVNK